MITNKNKFSVQIIFLVGLCLIIGIVAGSQLIPSYLSRTDFCAKMAKQYLENFMAKETGGEGSSWELAVDIETDIYNLCVLDPNQESASNFKSVVREKYQ